MAPRAAGLFALALLGVSAGLSVYAATRPPPSLAPAKLKAGELALDAPLPDKVPPGVTLVVGDPMTKQVLEHTGWIRDLPFKIKWAEIYGGPAVTEAFHARVLDVGLSADIPPIHATWVGIPVKIVGVRFRKDPLDHPSFVLAVSPGSNIRTLADLKGKRIAYSPGQVQGEIVIRTLRSQGLTPKDVTLVEMPSTSADVYLNALASGGLDVAPVAAGPAVKRYVERYGAAGARVLHHSDDPDDLAVVYVRDETLEDPAKAAALKAYVRMWGRAQAWISAHPQEWAQLYYVQHERLSPGEASFAVTANGEADVPVRWDEAIRRQQSTINLMAQSTRHPAFAANTLFDRRFEALAAEGAAQLDNGAGAKLAAR